MIGCVGLSFHLRNIHLNFGQEDQGKMCAGDRGERGLRVHRQVQVREAARGVSEAGIIIDT